MTIHLISDVRPMPRKGPRRVKPLARPNPWSLTKRQFELAELGIDGSTSKTLGKQIGLDPNTVNQHFQRVYRKMGVQNRTQMATTFVLWRAGVLS